MSDFWQGKNVLVTGAMGMVGSRLCEFLRDTGAHVYGMDDMSRGTFKVAGCEYWEGDASDYAEWQRMLYSWRIIPDVVFNLAAHVGGVYFNLKSHTSQFYKNVQLQTIPAMVAAQRKVPLFVQVSSVCVYADGYNNPAWEQNGHIGDPEPANAGYAWAKRMGERVCEWTFDPAITRWCIVRPTNMYGIRDYFDERAHVIPAIIKKMLTQDRATVYGGNQTREFLYADDGARGMMAVAERGECGQAYNLGTNGETQITIQRLAELIYALTGSTADVTLDMNAQTGDRGRCTDSTKANALGWRYQVGIEDGLGRVIEGYRDR